MSGDPFQNGAKSTSPERNLFWADFNSNDGLGIASDLITIETSDNSGLLASIAKVFFENRISIFSARINTLGERVEDTFEIENSDKTLVSESKIKKIISTLKKVV